MIFTGILCALEAEVHALRADAVLDPTGGVAVRARDSATLTVSLAEKVEHTLEQIVVREGRRLGRGCSGAKASHSQRRETASASPMP